MVILIPQERPRNNYLKNEVLWFPLMLLSHLVLSEIWVLLNFSHFCIGGDIRVESSCGQNGLFCTWLNDAAERGWFICKYSISSDIRLFEFVYVYVWMTMVRDWFLVYAAELFTLLYALNMDMEACIIWKHRFVQSMNNCNLLQIMDSVVELSSDHSSFRE